MMFGEVPSHEAAGAILAHTIRLGPANVIKKGHLLTALDCEALFSAGVQNVMVARLDSDDISEDAAAARIAEALSGDHISLSKATTGRANGYAEKAGVLIVSAERLNAVNLADEAVTVATLPPYSMVEPGAMVHTVKIIPFAVPRAVLQGVLARISLEEREPHDGQRAPGSLVSIAPFIPKRVGLILTKLPGTRDEIIEHGRRAQETRVTRLGGHIAETVIVNHTISSVENALSAMLTGAEKPDIVLMLGASAIVDRNDVVPSALVAAGGHIVHLGMPVDPGNLLLLGRVSNAHIIGVPGCARSLKRSGFDFVLERLFANIEVNREDVMKMGCGGLLGEIPSRRLPRDVSMSASAIDEGGMREDVLETDLSNEKSNEPRVHALVLAAGLSRRMGSSNKLLALVEGVPMIARVVDALLASKASGVSVVIGHQANLIKESLKGRNVQFIENPAFEEGLGASLRAGIANVPPDADAALVALGDMPFIAPHQINAVIQSFDREGMATICVPVHDRKRGHPVLWSRCHFAEMATLGGDVGARVLMEKHAESVKLVPISDTAILMDVDTPEMLAAAQIVRKETVE